MVSRGIVSRFVVLRAMASWVVVLCVLVLRAVVLVTGAWDYGGRWLWFWWLGL